MIGKERRQTIDNDPDLRPLPFVVMGDDPHFVSQVVDHRAGANECALLIADETRSPLGHSDHRTSGREKERRCRGCAP